MARIVLPLPLPLLLLSLLPHLALAGRNGMARLPPLGWRSWNSFSWQIDESTILTAMAGLTDTSRPIVGLPVGSSLVDVGFAEVGLDEGWASVGWPNGWPDGGWAYHRTNADGVTVSPVVNTTLFPSLLNLTTLLHSRGLRAGFYLNDCLSYYRELGDTCPDEVCSPGDVAFFAAAGFDSLKTDGCSAQHNMSLWGDLLYATDKGPGLLLENCGTVSPPAPGTLNTSVPYHTYRISTDIRNSFGSTMQNAQYVQKYVDGGTHGPGLWAYPDMLMIGVTTDVNGPLNMPTLAEHRTHFGLWCVLSSPLTLSIDFSNATNTDLVWPVVSNVLAVGVNQAWAGSPGGRFAEAADNATLEHCTPVWAGDKNCTLPSWQAYYKPLPPDPSSPSAPRVALFLANLGPTPLDLSLPLSSVPALPCGGGAGDCVYAVTDVWAQAQAGQADGVWDVRALAPHDSAFAVLQKVG
jgi:alpha-galactosidase